MMPCLSGDGLTQMLCVMSGHDLVQLSSYHAPDFTHHDIFPYTCSFSVAGESNRPSYLRLLSHDTDVCTRRTVCEVCSVQSCDACQHELSRPTSAAAEVGSAASSQCLPSHLFHCQAIGSRVLIRAYKYMALLMTSSSQMILSTL